MKNLKEFADTYEDTVRHCAYVVESFQDFVNADARLKELRDFVEQHAYGFGERCFYWMWKLIAQELPPDAYMLEIGVHRGQIVALWRMLLPDANIIGLSPYDGTEMGIYRDYRDDVMQLFDRYGLDYPAMIKGLSDDPDVIQDWVPELGKEGLDVLYIDGGHSYETTRSDIMNYSPLVKVGGYLIIDDSACLFHHPHDKGFFMGINTVAHAVDEILPPYAHNTDWQHLGNVMHNRIWKRL